MDLGPRLEPPATLRSAAFADPADDLLAAERLQVVGGATSIVLELVQFSQRSPFLPKTAEKQFHVMSTVPAVEPPVSVKPKSSSSPGWSTVCRYGGDWRHRRPPR